MRLLLPCQGSGEADRLAKSVVCVTGTHHLIQTVGMDFQVPGFQAVTLTFMLNFSLGVPVFPRDVSRPRRAGLGLSSSWGTSGAIPGSEDSGVFGCWRQPTVWLTQRQLFHKSGILPFSLAGALIPKVLHL